MSLFLLQCKNDGEEKVTSSTGTDPMASCYTCHGENTTLGNKLQWARAGWDESVHANGLKVPIFGQFYNTGTLTYDWFVAGYEFEGSDAFYSNGQGCQICHTKEGFLKRINGDYGTVDWTSGSAFLTAIGADTISNPTPLNCFTCHAPHTKQTFDLNVTPGTSVTTEAGTVYAKAKGSECASCHMARLSGNATANAYIAASTTIKSFASYWGAHHGPQTDMLGTNGGAEYTGLIYTNATIDNHSGRDDANCVNCHMASDFANLDEPSRYALSPAVGGHSMNVTGIVHGSPAANIAGCTYTGCHEIIDPLNPAVKAETVGSFGAAVPTAGGYLPAGKAYVNKTTGPATSALLYTEVNAFLTLLADPAASCTGLLESAAVAYYGVSVKWATMPDGTLPDPTQVNKIPCTHAGFTGDLVMSAAPANANQIAFLQAFWNFKYILEDKSMGVHNPTYVRRLLYDSCSDLNTRLAAGVDCTLGGTFTRP